MPSPEVSVVLPTHNRWPFLSRALASALGQTGVDLEVLVIDDASSDDTPEELAAIRDPRLRVIRQPRNQGVARARNRGIDEAHGTWIAFLDDDDVWAPEHLRRQLRALSEAGAGWAYGATYAVDPDGEPLKVHPAPDPAGLLDRLLDANLVGPPCSVLARREVVDAVGRFDENLGIFADWDLWIRLARRADAAACKTPLVAYCLHSQNMQRTERSRKVAELEYLIAKYEALVPDGRRFGGLMLEHLRVNDDRWEGRRFRAAAGFARLGIRKRYGKDLLRAAALLVLGTRMPAVYARAGRRRIPAPPWLERAFSSTISAPAAPPAFRPAETQKARPQYRADPTPDV